MASRAGFRLGRDRIQLAEHRLAPVARREGFDSVDAMLATLWAKPVASLGWAVIEALLNPETWFRRDRTVFDTFARELLPAIGRARPEGLVQRLVRRLFAPVRRPSPWPWPPSTAGANVEIVATDLSQRAVERGRGRRLHRLRDPARPLGPDHAALVRSGGGRLGRQAGSAATRSASPAHNLLDAPADAAQFDIILCRNVLSEMDPAKRGQVVEGLERRLVDDGCPDPGRRRADRRRHRGLPPRRRPQGPVRQGAVRAQPRGLIPVDTGWLGPLWSAQRRRGLSMRWALFLGSLAVALLIGVWALQVPAPRGRDTAAVDFSAARAMTDVRAIAARPHPVGSADHARVQQYLFEPDDRAGAQPDAPGRRHVARGDRSPETLGRRPGGGGQSGGQHCRRPAGPQPRTPGRANHGALRQHLGFARSGRRRRGRGRHSGNGAGHQGARRGWSAP